MQSVRTRRRVSFLPSGLFARSFHFSSRTCRASARVLYVYVLQIIKVVRCTYLVWSCGHWLPSKHARILMFFPNWLSVSALHETGHKIFLSARTHVYKANEMEQLVPLWADRLDCPSDRPTNRSLALSLALSPLSRKAPSIKRPQDDRTSERAGQWEGGRPKQARKKEESCGLTTTRTMYVHPASS